MKGTVKWFNALKGYGFIVGGDGVEYFAHYSKIKSDGYRKLTNGEEVSFAGTTEEKGFTALEIERLMR